jgi:hypothetical protein
MQKIKIKSGTTLTFEEGGQEVFGKLPTEKFKARLHRTLQAELQ